MQSEYVRIDRNFYHECILERGDTLEDVCQHFGYDANIILMLPLNEGFRVSFAFVLQEPSFSEYDNPPPVYIPADSGSSGGVLRVAVSPIETYCLQISLIEMAAGRIGISLSAQDLITYIRKLYYFGNLWDAIIPRARTINMPAALSNDPDVQSAIEYMRNHQVLPIDGRSVDIGHVFAGLDTRYYIERNFDLSVTIDETLGIRIPTLNFSDNFSLATWVADLGSIVVNYHNRTLSRAREYSEYYDNWMPPKDMRSDADSYIFDPFPIRSGRLSEHFSDFYLGTSSPRLQRFENFRQAINSDDSQWRQQTVDDVIDAAIGFAAMGDQGRHSHDVASYLLDFLSFPLGPSAGIGTRETYRSLSEQVVDSFVRQINDGESAIPLTPSLRGIRLR